MWGGGGGGVGLNHTTFHGEDVDIFWSNTEKLMGLYVYPW